MLDITKSQLQHRLHHKLGIVLSVCHEVEGISFIMQPPFYCVQDIMNNGDLGH